MHELFEELDAFHPEWKQKYRTLKEAAVAAGVLGIFHSWLDTPDGVAYTQNVASARDYLAEIEEHQRLVELDQKSLRYGYHNLSEVGGGAFK